MHFIVGIRYGCTLSNLYFSSLVNPNRSNLFPNLLALSGSPLRLIDTRLRAIFATGPLARDIQHLDNPRPLRL